MNELTLHETDIVARDGTPTRLVYDQEGDILEIFFGDNVPATGIELTVNFMPRTLGVAAKLRAPKVRGPLGVRGDELL